MHIEDTHLQIELPWLGSIGDVKLAFALMKALQKMYPDCGFLTNAEDTFVGMCQHVCLMSNKEVKDIPVRDFFKVIEGNPHFKMIDAGQFALSKMPDDEWQKLFDAIDVKAMRSPQTYLLRWNPTM